jgi:undecaprenyl-diphosphatase
VNSCLLTSLLCLLCSLLPASAALASNTETPSLPAAELQVRDAIVLGVVEGVTEFLPISSTGHLIIANQLLGLESEQPLTNSRGEPLWYKPPTPENPAGVPLTLKIAADTYTVIIQAGAVAAVCVLYWQQLVSMLVGLIGRSSQGFRLLRNIMLACLPVVVSGLLLHNWIDAHLFSVGAVIWALVVGALLMLWAERWRKANSGIGYSRNEPSDISAGKAASIGLFQCLALWPGTSRSMVTIVGGYLAGLQPAKAAEFSFLVGLPTLAGAAVYKAWKSGPAMIEVFGWGNVLVGTMVAAITAALAIKLLVKFLTRHGLAVFAYYRLVLAAALLVFYVLPKWI